MKNSIRIVLVPLAAVVVLASTWMFPSRGTGWGQRRVQAAPGDTTQVQFAISGLSGTIPVPSGMSLVITSIHADFHAGTAETISGTPFLNITHTVNGVTGTESHPTMVLNSTEAILNENLSDFGLLGGAVLLSADHIPTDSTGSISVEGFEMTPQQLNEMLHVGVSPTLSSSTGQLFTIPVSTFLNLNQISTSCVVPPSETISGTPVLNLQYTLNGVVSSESHPMQLFNNNQEANLNIQLDTLSSSGTSVAVAALGLPSNATCNSAVGGFTSTHFDELVAFELEKFLLRSDLALKSK